MSRCRARLFLVIGLTGCAGEVLLGLTGCAGEVPSPTLIDDVRVLAVRAEPPELLMDRGAEAAAAVSFQALVVDPRGPSMAYQWSFCPVESSETCADFAQRRAAAPPRYQPILDTTRAQGQSGQSPPVPDGAAFTVDPFTVAIPPALFDYHLASSGLGLGNGSWLSAVLELQAGGESLQAQKRVVLGARDLAAWNPELAAFGWQVCPPDAPGPGCVPLAPRTPNRNPELAGIELARSARADAPFQAIAGDSIDLAPGAEIRLRPVLGPGADERYQTVDSALQGNQLIVVDHTEEPVVSWFTTAGKFGSDQTTAQLTRTLDNTFTAPRTPPADGRLWIYLVVRDQRGGVGWTRLAVVVE
jgi:hypothetical protein